MTKLKNAPLVEIVLELRWEMLKPNSFEDMQYLHSDMYSDLKKDYPFRENIAPSGVPLEFLINQPIHRFWQGENNYPLFQVGPGLLTFNTNHEQYDKNDFIKRCKKLIATFVKNFKHQASDQLSPSLLFLDFFPFDFEKNNVYDYLNQNFSIEFSQKFIKEDLQPFDLNLGFFYKVPLGDLSVNFSRARNLHNVDGIILQTRINGQRQFIDEKKLLDWVSDAKKECNNIFKSLTIGKLYDSFKGEKK